MKGIFDYDSKFMQWACRAAEYMFLNILTVLCSLPIITAGAAFTAMYYTLSKMGNDACSSVGKEFFKSFRMNLLQSTVLELMYLILALILWGDYYVVNNVWHQKNIFLMVLLAIGVILWLLSFTWGFILQARYNNPLKATIKNTVVVGGFQIIYTIPVLVLKIAPWVLLVFVPDTAPFVLMFGFSASGYAQEKLYRNVYRKCEETL